MTKSYVIKRGTNLDTILDALRREKFEYTVPDMGVGLWDITVAKLEAAEGNLLDIVEVPRDQMENIVKQYSIEEAHLINADVTKPGIAAPMVYEGKLMYIIIDGTHRCTRAYREDKPFFVQLLTDEAARRCHVSGLDKLMPWNQ